MQYADYLNIPYKHLGRDRTGVDCYGLIILYFKELFGKELKDWWYEEDWAKKGGNYFVENYESVAKKVSFPKVHDIVLLYTDLDKKVINHAGIIIDEKGKFIQAIRKGVVISSIYAPIIRTRIEGFYRLCLN